MARKKQTGKRAKGRGRRGRSRSGGRRRSAGGLRARLKRRLLAGAILLGVLAVGVGGLLWSRCGLAGCPDPGSLVSFTPGGAPTLLDRYGEEVGSLHSFSSEPIPLGEMPSWLPEAFLAVEDRRFLEHRGVDWIRLGGAFLRNLRTEGRAQGASTVSMQLARSVFPERISRLDRSVRRKLVEIRVARQIESRYSKSRILELYLNHVYLGAGLHGVGAMAHHLFAREADELSLAESALMAGMARSPASYDPRRFPDRALGRRNLVLSLMEDQGRITEAEAEAARVEPLGVTSEPPPPASPTLAPYFVRAVRQELEERLGPEVYAPGLRIYTTLDVQAQSAAEEELAAHLDAIEAGRFGAYRGPRFDPFTPGGAEGTDYLQGAVVVLEVGSGEVLALLGGRDFVHSRFDRAAVGRRPVGSAFKPFVFAAALEAGILPSQPIQDRPFRLVSTGSEDWTPRNHDLAFRGPVRMEDALVHSLNIPTARLALAAGLPRVVDLARRAGVDSPIPENPAAALGTASLSPLELTVAYATLAGMGLRYEPRFLLRVEDAVGRDLYRAPSVSTRALDPRVTYLVTEMLQEAVRTGTGRGAGQGVRGPVAGKTGTTQGATDVWFAGYTPERAATVWIGHDRPRPFLAGASGGALAAPLWGRIMARLDEAPSPAGGAPSRSWSAPEGLVEVVVDPESGQTLAPECRGRSGGEVRYRFLAEFQPAEICPEEEDEGGFLSRVAQGIRGLFGRRSEPEEPAAEASTAGAAGTEVLRVGPPSSDQIISNFLGAPRIPLR